MLNNVTKESIAKTVESFTALTNLDSRLKEMRDFVEKHVYGFGERCFYHMWKLVLDELPDSSDLMEIGVYKGQIIALWRLLKPESRIFGISPLSSYAGNDTPSHPDTDYVKHIKDLHNHLKISSDNTYIFNGLSTDQAMYERVKGMSFNVLYIDGCHERWAVEIDFKWYSPLVKVGGYLVVDDASCNLPIPYGMFPGIKDVSDVTDEWYSDNKESFEEIMVVMHNRVFKRIK
ncbi:MAG: class I SAM-dependent methyltransferase [Pseudomonadota bacterium]|uniref:Putative methyltransferase n=1 Tax=viral metagenome TaxID=1070528 RepID=A0A6H1ZHG2_9ZZZZ